MRGILITTLPSGEFQCTVCGLKPGAEIHTAQGTFWLVPVAHTAPCGQPCIGGGIDVAPFRGHLGNQKCESPRCKVEAPKKVENYEKARLPTWIYNILLPILQSPQASSFGLTKR